MLVTKRDGRQVPFDPSKIEVAITKAYWEEEYFPTHPKHPHAEEIAKKIQDLNKDMTVEGIQDLVEKELMACDPETAKKYIIYRNKRSHAREQHSRIFQTIRRRLDAIAVQNANANVDERSFSGREKEASADIQKIYALEDVLSEEVSAAHRNMLIYQHDLEKAPIGQHNCLNIDFKKLFKEGFETRNGDIRPPATFSTACQQVAVIFQCQSQVQFGGVGTVHLDFDLAPFVKNSFRKHFLINAIKNCEDALNINFTNMEDEEIDEWIYKNKQQCLDFFGLTDEDICIDNKKLNKLYYQMAMLDLRREMRQSAEALYHNLNTLESRAGSQVPFTSINFGRDTSTEGRMVSRAMLNASISGIGRFHRTSIFPISIFQYKTGCNANSTDPNYDLKLRALTSLSKRIYPNFCNCDWSQAHEDPSNPDTFFSTMGKRKLQPM